MNSEVSEKIDFVSQACYTQCITIRFYAWGGDTMPDGLEIIQKAIEDFTKIQENMMLAKEENAIKTYANLKKDYISLKALLTVAGVNLTELDKIKE